MTGSNSFRPGLGQAEAIGHGGGPLRILAGAGSGKTTTLVERIKRLLAEGHCRPAELLMLTFTNKAVADMRRKVAAGLPPGAEQPRIETYHAYALSLVQEFGPDLGLPPAPALLAEGPVRLFVRRRFDRLGIAGLDLSRLDDVLEKALDFFGRHRYEGSYRKDRAALLAGVASDDQPLVTEMLAAFDAYRALLKEHGAVDYDDAIALSVELLETNAAVRQEVCARYRFLLVDEYQDTDPLQGRFIQLLAGDHGNITIVGDPDQTIYSFRGAALANILDFHQAFPGVRDVAMVTSYRSTPAIVAAANAVIAHNTRSKEQSLVAYREQGALPRPQLVTAPDWETEARWLAAEVKRLHGESQRWGDMAVLVRQNKHKLPLYAALLEAGIPVRVVGGMDLFADGETHRFITYLRALAAPEHDGYLSVALSMPRYGLTDAEVAALSQSRGSGDCLMDAVARAAAGHPALQVFLDEFWPIYRLQFAEGHEAAIRVALALHAPAMGLQGRLNADQLLPLAQAFFAQAALLTAGEAASPLGRFCDYLAALRDAGEPPEGAAIQDDEDAVLLMTVHAAKGLEFPVVFLPRLTDRDFPPRDRNRPTLFPPSWRHDQSAAANPVLFRLEEERRLFYVAITRAMDRLYLSWAPVDPARKKPVGPSAFLAELGETVDTLEAEASSVGAERQEDVAGLLTPLVSRQPARPMAAAAPGGTHQPKVPAVLSFSHLSTYQFCPFRFYVQYLLRLPGRPAPAADAGVRIHAAIERLSMARGENVTFEEFRAWAAAPVLPAEGDPEGAEAREEEEELAEPGAPFSEAEALRCYWESEYGKTPPVAVEQEFYIRLGDAVVRGFIDRIHRRADGTIEVVDFKAYGHQLTETQVHRSLQLPLYIKACREALGMPSVNVGAMYFLRHDATVRVTYTEEELAERWAEAERLIAGARGGDWNPTAGVHCRYCPYGEICPVSGAS